VVKSCLFLTRVLKHLGCPHGCADGQRGPPADFLRSQGQNILSKLHRASPRQFSRFLREMVCNQTISDILDFFHAYVGFCVDPSSLLSPLSKYVLPIKFCKASCICVYYCHKFCSPKAAYLTGMSFLSYCIPSKKFDQYFSQDCDIVEYDVM
jgi:hypothetical protein